MNPDYLTNSSNIFLDVYEKKNNVKNYKSYDISNKINNNKIIPNNKIVEYFLKILEKNNINCIVNTSINNIILKETISKENLNVKKSYVIAKKINGIFNIDGYNIYGNGSTFYMVFSDSENPDSYNMSFMGYSKKIDRIKIEDRNIILNLACKYIDNVTIDDIDAILCYYSAEESNNIVPAYKIKNKTDKTNFLEFFLPGNLDYLPEVSFDQIIVTRDNINDQFITISIFLKNFSTNSFIKIISNFDIIDNLNNNNSFLIKIPRQYDKELISTQFQVKLLLTNKFGFTNYKNIFVDCTEYIKLIENVSNNLNKQSIIYDNNYTGNLSHIMYLEAIKKNSNISNTTNSNYRYTNSDTVIVIGDNSYEIYNDKNNLEFNTKLFVLYLISKLLFKTTNIENLLNTKSRYIKQHLLFSFYNNIAIQDDKLLLDFANNQYIKEQTIINSWINSLFNNSFLNQNAFIMGPLVNDSDSRYNSVLLSNSNLYMAYCNDYNYGIKVGPGDDLNKNKVVSWWQILIE